MCRGGGGCADFWFKLRTQQEKTRSRRRTACSIEGKCLDKFILTVEPASRSPRAEKKSVKRCLNNTKTVWTADGIVPPDGGRPRLNGDSAAPSDTQAQTVSGASGVRPDAHNNKGAMAQNRKRACLPQGPTTASTPVDLCTFNAHVAENMFSSNNKQMLSNNSAENMLSNCCSITFVVPSATNICCTQCDERASLRSLCHH